jgi:general secretion pathway protein K
MTQSDSRRGMVLVAVLWSISLLSALAMAASVTFRGYAGVMAVERDQLQAEALLTAGLETAAGILQNSGDSPLTEVETTVTLDTGAVHVRLDDEGGRIDIGKAPVDVLASMFRSVGVPEAVAGAVAQRIVERRSHGNAPSPANPGNAATPVNDASPSNEAPQLSATNQPFADLGELHSVQGMEPEWIEAIAPLTTVFGDQTVNPLTAPQAVIAALPGVDAQTAAAFIRARRNSFSSADQLVRLLGPAQQYLAVKSKRVASVDLTAELASGYTTTAHAVIVALPQDSQPYRVLIWTPMPYAKASIWAGPMAQR